MNDIRISTYLGVKNFSTNTYSGASALKGFLDAGFRRGCRLGSLANGSDMSLVTSTLSLGSRFPRKIVIFLERRKKIKNHSHLFYISRVYSGHEDSNERCTTSKKDLQHFLQPS